MMYHVKNIIYDEEIALPQCMYNVKRIFDFDDDVNADENIDLKIREQVINFLKKSDTGMAELESRQDVLLKKLDVLYDRIMKISSICDKHNITKVHIPKVPAPEEIVVNTNTNNLPLYLYLLSKKKECHFNLAWHIHSSVSNEKIPKIKAFMKKFTGNNHGKINVRLIFHNVSADTELKLSSLAMPIVGHVNVLRYLALAYPSVFPSIEDFTMDSHLDECYLLQKASEKNKECIAKKLFSQSGEWICNNQLTIVDIAAYNVIKQWRNCPKYIPCNWLKNCELLYK